MQFHLRLPMRQLLGWHVVTIEAHTHQPVLPSARPAQVGELMLSQIHSRKAIGIHPRHALIIRHKVELAECLAKWLPDTSRKNPLAPPLQLLHARRQRMP
jgi:hypothetical protein